MNAKQYAERVGVDVRRVREWCEKGIIPCERGAKGKRFVIIPLFADEALRNHMAGKEKAVEKQTAPPRPIKRGSFLDELRRI